MKRTFIYKAQKEYSCLLCNTVINEGDSYISYQPKTGITYKYVRCCLSCMEEIKTMSNTEAEEYLLKKMKEKAEMNINKNAFVIGNIFKHFDDYSIAYRVKNIALIEGSKIVTLEEGNYKNNNWNFTYPYITISGEVLNHKYYESIQSVCRASQCYYVGFFKPEGDKV
ncbi:MAG: hypothetical protein PF569_09215 [Candidatus Woesearchaeota archaeon]|jgi:hypothetical protein|nr:hypothetical protein [Candidatus Woesearchaeota archaeon]